MREQCLYGFKELFALSLLGALFSCADNNTPHNITKTDSTLEIYPEYREVSLPCNIAPLNFLIRNKSVNAVQAQVGEITQWNKGNKIQWDETAWKQMISNHVGDTLSVKVMACIDDQWLQFDDLQWYVSPDSVDSYVTYRLIEPGYEVWHEVEIEERCIESFNTRTLADGKQLGNKCMNCHTHGGNEGQYSYFYIRGSHGGAFVNRNGNFEKLALNNAKTNGSTVYGGWHPEGRYGVFSTNVIIPAFHADPACRLEVYDTQSDLCVADFDTQRMITSPLVSQTDHTLETFPSFSADGITIYYCSAPNPCGDTIPRAEDLQHLVKQLHYSLNRIGFDAENGSFTGPIETVIEATDSTSVNFPRFSPDGKWLTYCESSYGTFPIWHLETRLVLTPAQQPSIETNRTRIQATYHTWSHNSRWIAFASKEYDTQYGRVYLMHVGEDGALSNPLVLPQADPSHDDLYLKSYNIPDLSMHAMPYDNTQVKQLLDNTEAIQFTE